MIGSTRSSTREKEILKTCTGVGVNHSHSTPPPGATAGRNSNMQSLQMQIDDSLVAINEALPADGKFGHGPVAIPDRPEFSVHERSREANSPIALSAPVRQPPWLIFHHTK